MANMQELLSQRFEVRKQKLVSMDIVAVAESLGMKLKPGSSGTYYWEEHDSFHIYPNTNTFRWWSRSIGSNTIDLVQVVREELTGQKPSFKEAAAFLETGQFENVTVQPPVKEPFEYYLERYEHSDFNIGRQYLKEERGLSDETIDTFLASGNLATATHKKGDYFEPVIVFKSRNNDGKMIGASLQGIVENRVQHPERGRLKQMMKNSDGTAGFSLDIGNPKRLVFAEAPIDLMSYYELHKDDLQDVKLVAMDGMKKSVISRYVADMLTDGKYSQTMSNEQIRGALDALNKTTNILQEQPDMITLAVDNDEAGQSFIKGLQDDGIPVVPDLPPRQANQEKMDWNDYLKQETKTKESTVDETWNIDDIQEQLSQESDLVGTQAVDVVYMNEVYLNQGYSLSLAIHSNEEVENLTDVAAPWTLEVMRNGQSLGYLAYGEDWGNDFDIEDELGNLETWVKDNQVTNHLYTQKDVNAFLATTQAVDVVYMNEVYLNQGYSLSLAIHSNEEVENLTDVAAPWTLEVMRNGQSLGYLAYGEDWGNDFDIEDELGNLETWVKDNQVTNHLYTQKDVNAFLATTQAVEPQKGEFVLKGGGIYDFGESQKEGEELRQRALDGMIADITDGETYYLWHDEELENLNAPDEAFINFHYHLKDIEYNQNDIHLYVAESSTDGVTGYLSLDGNSLDSDSIEEYLADQDWTFDQKVQFLKNLKTAVDETWDKVIDHYDDQFEAIVAQYGLSNEKEKSPEELQETEIVNFEQQKKVENPIGDLPEQSQEAAPLPSTHKEHSLNESSPTQTQSQPLLHFTISEPEKSIYKNNFDVIVKAARADNLLDENSDFYKEVWVNKIQEENQKVQDSDGDGLTDDEEIALGTNPYSPDTDGDGILDSVEKASGTDATNPSDTPDSRKEEMNKRDLTLSEMIKAKNTAALNQHLQEGIKDYFDSDNYKNYLEGMSHFNNYSARNIRLIKAQLPKASMVASFNEWKKRNGHVNKGEKALYVQAPITVIKKDADGKPIINSETGEKETFTYFKPVPVFDISQVSPVEGKKLNLPKMGEVIPSQITKEYYQNVYRSLRDISQKENGIPIRFRELEKSDGSYSPKTNEITIKKGMTYEQTLSTLIHEMAHSELHNKKSLTERFEGKLTRSSKELQAESIAYVVSNHLGFDTSNDSFAYLASWSQEPDGLENLKAQLEIVQEEASSLMKRIDKYLEKYQSLTVSKDEKLTESQKRELSKAANPFYQSLQKAKEESKQVTPDNEEQSKKVNRPTKQ